MLNEIFPKRAGCKATSNQTDLLTCTCVGIHPGRVKPAPPTALTTSLTILRHLTRHLYPVLSPSCVAEDSRSEDRFQVGLDRGSPCLQLASSSSAPRARRCGKEKVLDKLTFGTSCGMSKPAEPSLHEQCWYACKAEAAPLY